MLINGALSEIEANNKEFAIQHGIRNTDIKDFKKYLKNEYHKNFNKEPITFQEVENYKAYWVYIHKTQQQNQNIGQQLKNAMKQESEQFPDLCGQYSEYIINSNKEVYNMMCTRGAVTQVNIDNETESPIKKAGLYGGLMGESGAIIGAMKDPDVKRRTVMCKTAEKGLRFMDASTNPMDLRVPYGEILQVSYRWNNIIIIWTNGKVNINFPSEVYTLICLAVVMSNCNFEMVSNEGW